MKKSTVVLILIVYLASIVVVGFFGMKVKVYDEISYVKSIEVTVQAESAEMYEFEDTGISTITQNHTYRLKLFFTDHHLVDGEGVDYLPIIFMPQVTYESGDIASEAEKIKYSIISSVDYEAQGKVSLSERGELKCFDNMIVFTVVVSPEKSNLVGSKAEIEVWVF